MKDQKFSFLIELAKQQFDESATGASAWMMAMPIGNYQHPVYGKINLTMDRIRRFAENVNRGIRGQDLDIDYDHKEYGGEAAGWVKQAEARPDGLWLLVEWTQKAYEAIKSKAYRYFSPEFDDVWSDPRTGEKFKDVLFGGGITNRPFLKGIQPLNLSEFYTDQRVALKENGSMDPEQIKELAAKLGLGDTATPEMLFGALMMKLGGDGGDPNPPADPPKSDANPPDPNAPDPAKKNEENGAAVTQQFSEKDLLNNPVVKKLTEQLESQSKKFAEMALESNIKKLSDAAVKGGHLLTPVQETGIKKMLSESTSDEHTDTIVKTLSEILATPGPETGESGGQSRRLNEPNADAAKKFDEKIKARMLSDKIDYASAAVLVASEDNDGFAEYRDASYETEGE
jgi:phage I-like protein